MKILKSLIMYAIIIVLLLYIPSQALAQTHVEKLEWQIFNMVNSERTSRGLPALQMDSLLKDMARAHSKDMGDNNYFSHTSPTTGSFGDRLKNSKIEYFAAGENIAQNKDSESDSAAITMQGWMNSTGHRNNILGSHYIFTGIGVYRAGDGSYYYTQVFIGANSTPSYILMPPYPQSTFGIGLYDQQRGRFYIKDDTIDGPADRVINYGPRNNNWLPVAGDWNGDGKYGIGLYDQQRGRFYIKDDTTDGPADRVINYGPRNNDWLPVAGDWNGDGKHGIGLYDQQRGRFYIKDNTTDGPADRVINYGPRNNNWLPVAGDWNGDGKHGIGLYDQQRGRFYIKDYTIDGPADRAFNYGPRGNNWLPTAGDWNDNGSSGIGLYDQQGVTFYIKDYTEAGPADRTFRYGPRNNNWLPVAGSWIY